MTAPGSDAARPAERRRHLALVAVLCAALQAASATWIVTRFETPNASTDYARTLAATGRYEANYGARLWGPAPERAGEPLRLYILPGEALYLAAALRALPPQLLRYVHVPVTTLLVVAVAAFAGVVGGPRLAVAAGLVAALQPFVLVHGPVWDDIFLGAALLWAVLACMAARTRAATPQPSPPPLSPPRLASLAAVAAAAGLASVTRAEVPPMLALVGLAVVTLPSLRAARPEAMSALLGATLALGAWGVRNYVAVGQLSLGASADGITLWEWNGPWTRAAAREGRITELSLDPRVMAPHWAKTRHMSEVEASRYFTRQALRFVATHPGTEVATVARKLLYTATGLRPWVPVRSPRNVVALAANALTFALAAAGAAAIVRDRERRRRLAPVAALVAPLVATEVLVLLVGPIGLRYRIVLDGVLWTAAAVGVLHLLDRLHARPDPAQ